MNHHKSLIQVDIFHGKTDVVILGRAVAGFLNI
jgi:hypothetical protein